MQRAVIFDMDGVLVNSYQAHYRSWQMLAQRHGLDLTEQQFATTFGRTSRENIRTFWPHVRQTDIPAWDDQKEAFYRQILEQDFPAMDGVNELLEDLHRARFKLAVGSSGPPPNVAVVVRCLRAGRLLDATVNGSDVHLGKPDPAVFLTAARRLGVQPRCCAVVEDAPVGVEAARRADMASIALTGTASPEELAGADLVVDSLRALWAQRIARLIDARQQGAREKHAKDNR